MIKLKNSVHVLTESEKKINQLEVKGAFKIHSNKMCLFLDMRDIGEIKKYKPVLGSKHIARSILEFWTDPNSPYNKVFFNKNIKFIFYCVLYLHSTLTTLTVNNIDLFKISHLTGDYYKWLELEDPIEKTR